MKVGESRLFSFNDLETLYHKNESIEKDKTSLHWNNEVFNKVESEGFEPSSKRRATKLSTCLFFG